MVFKMKGSPMRRNFGIESPVKVAEPGLFATAKVVKKIQKIGMKLNKEKEGEGGSALSYSQKKNK